MIELALATGWDIDRLTGLPEADLATLIDVLQARNGG